MTASRKIALQMLCKMQQNDCFSNILLDQTFNREKLLPRDKAFCTALFYGVLERRMTLDYIIRCYSDIEFDKLSPETLNLLRMGIYQLLYMNSVPENAAVNETVELAPKSSRGFINAILRGFIRDEKKIETSKLDELGTLSITYSFPKWLIKKWRSYYGNENAEMLLKSAFGRPPLFVKVNTLHFTVPEVMEALKREKIDVVRNKLLDTCLEISGTNSIEATNAFRKGMFHVQDISSQLCCKIFRPVFNETVIDVCAAPGGKSFTIAEGMNNMGKVFSFDLYDGKLSLINEGAKRLGISIISTARNDATVFSENVPMADKVLCDAVCSGLGVFRRKPEIKYKPMKSIEDIPSIQKSILSTASRYVKPGGTLVYSTCTLIPEENEAVVNDFLSSHSDFTPIVVPVDVPGMDNSFMRTFMPHITGGDGFFVATLRRNR